MDKKFTIGELLIEIVRRFSSRKFLCPLIYIVILILNYTQDWGLPEELLAVVAGLLGIYELVEGSADYKSAKASN